MLLTRFNGRDSLINQVRDHYQNVFELVAPVVAFTLQRGTDFERLEDQAKGTLARMNEMADTNEKAMQEAKNGAQEVLNEVRRIAAEAGISQYAAHFKNESDRNDTSAKPWLTWTIALASGTVALSLALTIRYFFALPSVTPSQSVQLAIPKLFLFSVFLSATIWAGKNYRAYRHNAIVNRHRQNP